MKKIFLEIIIYLKKFQKKILKNVGKQRKFLFVKKKNVKNSEKERYFMQIYIN